jgi:hypothetical protein
MPNNSPFSGFMQSWLLIAAMLLSWTLVARAQTDSTQGKSGNEMKWSEDKLAQIEENLVRDLESSSVGICIGGAQTARELKSHVPEYDFSKIIIPLMRIVKDENADRAARILAALALHDLRSERGDFAISREGEMSKDEVFKSFCANLARGRMAEKKK